LEAASAQRSAARSAGQSPVRFMPRRSRPVQPSRDSAADRTAATGSAAAKKGRGLRCLRTPPSRRRESGLRSGAAERSAGSCTVREPAPPRSAIERSSAIKSALARLAAVATCFPHCDVRRWRAQHTCAYLDGLATPGLLHRADPARRVRHDGALAIAHLRARRLKRWRTRYVRRRSSH
jgi:hypothetical protein